MSLKAKVLAIVKKKKEVSSSQVAEIIDISRQMAHRYLSRLEREGAISRVGSRRAARYKLGKTSQKGPSRAKVIRNLAGLHEDEVFEELSTMMGLKKRLNANSWQIAYYAFTEMLNNAIDHSDSEKVRIGVYLAEGDFSFIIRDEGIGIFNRLQKGFKLENHYQAIELLFKGKQTTFPERHSGQGIFFTSRVADSFRIRSSALEIEIDNKENDQIISPRPVIKGTEVFFRVKQQTRKKIEEFFKNYSNEDFEFDKNVIRPKLNSASSLISRSQARKLLAGMEKFERIVFDFRHITGIGQAFADEIFRVFTKHHPKVEVDYLNAGEAVEYMIQRAMKKE